MPSLIIFCSSNCNKRTLLILYYISTVNIQKNYNLFTTTKEINIITKNKISLPWQTGTTIVWIPVTTSPFRIISVKFKTVIP